LMKPIEMRRRCSSVGVAGDGITVGIGYLALNRTLTSEHISVAAAIHLPCTPGRRFTDEVCGA